MPFVPDYLKHAQCPYCYEGVIEYDKFSNKFFCCVCNKIVLIINDNKT